MPDWSWLPLIALGANIVTVVMVGVRVILHRHPVGVSLAWLTVLFTVPFVGAALYLLIGERRIGRRRMLIGEQVLTLFRGWLRDLSERAGAAFPAGSTQAPPMQRQIERTIGMPALPGNALEILVDAESMLRALIADIDAATATVRLEYYIWHPGGTADEVVDAVLRAAGRGVRCAILVDAVGSAPFLEGASVARLREAGVAVVAALPVGMFRALFRRLDLRNHRKLALIDGNIAYTGSQNLVDPRHFKTEAGFGSWVDATVRISGPAVEALAGTFLVDWQVETGVRLGESEGSSGLHPVPPAGDSVVQVLPSGPGYVPEALHQALLTAIYSAGTELLVTTPYFVPDEAMYNALVSAAHRGVDVTVVVPARVDSFLVRHASRAHFLGLLEAGVRIAEFEAGLLHAKTITIDAATCLIGSINLDMRSLWLNKELTILVYDPRFAARVRSIQLDYVDRSRILDLERWRRRKVRRRLLENSVQLLSPLL
jgi:cardiolipin synthase